MNRIITIIIISSFLSIGCTNSNKHDLSTFEKIETENDSLRRALIENKAATKNQISTFLTFQDNNAENAMNFYVSLFKNSKINKIERWGKDGPTEEGKIMHATFELNGRSFMCSDSPPIHAWDFSPAVSNYIDCESKEEQTRLFSRLSENGEVTMPLNNYGFSQRFGWVIDQYGVSWQLNLQ